MVVRLRNGRDAGPVEIEVCATCGERYYDLAAMQSLEKAGQRRRRRPDAE